MTVRVERAGPVTTIILSRVEVRNAVDRSTALALADAFREFDSDDDASVAVLWGEGGNFCAGADLKAFASGQGNRVESEGDGPMGPTRMQLSKPLVCAIEGYAVAGGLELALWCDLRVAAQSAVLGVFCRRFGVPLIDGGTVRLPRIVGMGRALDMILTGRGVPSAEALSMGLVNRVVPDGSARQSAEALALQIAKFPASAMRGDRMSAYAQWDLPHADAMAAELKWGRAALDEALAGARRFDAGSGRHGDDDPENS
jgi:enoyl-CoA hydratase